MSRCRLDSTMRNTEVCIGWDPGFNTFFCYVIDFELGGGQDSIPCIHHGATDGEFTSPEELVDIILPYSCQFDRDELIRMLVEDGTTNSERTYSFEDEEDDD